MAVKLGCITTLTQALAYIDEERPVMQSWYPSQVGALDNARALIAQNQLQGGETDSAAVSQAKAYILAYQNQARASKGLAARNEADALSCVSAATGSQVVEEETPAETLSPDGSDAGGGSGSGWLWLLAAAGLGLLLWKKGGKKGGAKSKKSRRSRR